MSYNFRSRTVVNYQSPSVAKKTKKSTRKITKPSEAGEALKATRKSRPGSGKKQGQSSRAKEVISESVEKPPVSKESNQKRASQVARGRELHRSKGQQGATEEQERGTGGPRPVSSVNLQAKSNRTSFVTSWAKQIGNPLTSEVPTVHAVNESPAQYHHTSSAPWFRLYGYTSSDDDMESTSHINSEGQSKKTGGSASRGFKTDSRGFWAGLKARNINMDKVVDEDREWIEKKILQNPGATSMFEDESYWDMDMSKCKKSDEAIFQRTIMMHLISRHQLGDTLDYTCESKWDCVPMPQRGAELARRMPMPKPDLAVAFKASALLGIYKQPDLGDYMNLMCPEKFREDKCDRAFHFLSIEAKGASGKIANWDAHRQNFNTATQALHNIYFFMKMVGGKELEQFFTKVRFYSVVATSSIFHVRVHRAIEIEDEDGRIEEDYPLAFLYDEVCHKGDDFTRAFATRLIRNILVEYGVKTLQPLLEKTMKSVWESLRVRPNQNNVQIEPESQPTEETAEVQEASEAANVQQAQKAAEVQRGQQRAKSRRGRGATQGAQGLPRKKRQTQDTNKSFTREQLGNITLDETPSGTVEK